MERWAIYIDIEGFSKVYPQDSISALKPLRSLMEGIYHIGSKVCPETPNRLFAHQVGDGFVIVSEFAKRSPELPIAIATVLMQKVAIAGGVAKSAISKGEFSDIKGCYPDVIRENADDSGLIRLGRGLMRVFPVMGSALINAYRLSDQESGSLLLLDSYLAKNLPKGTIITKETKEYQIIDWIHSNTREIEDIKQGTNSKLKATSELEDIVRKYASNINSSTCSNWAQNTLSLNNC